jgi:phosphoribosylglycinamide formyltransferase-1
LKTPVANARPYNIAVLVSGGGTNFQALIDAAEAGALVGGRIVLVISSRSDAYSLTRAEKHGIPVFVADSGSFPDADERATAITGALRGSGADLVVLAGYMSILPPSIIREFEGRIINIHPSLIPKHCGKGYYGKRVHQSVINSGDKESGATVHYVDEGVDTGRVIVQEKVPVLSGDDADSLAKRVLETEHRIIVRGVNLAAEEILGKTKEISGEIDRSSPNPKVKER